MPRGGNKAQKRTPNENNAKVNQIEIKTAIKVRHFDLLKDTYLYKTTAWPRDLRSAGFKPSVMNHCSVVQAQK